MDIAQLDQALASHDIYANPEEAYAVFRKVHAEDPLHWTQPQGHHPFWAVTKHADLAEIGRRNDIFLNGIQAFLQDDEEMAATMAVAGKKTAPMRTIVTMDGEEHKKYRGILQGYFMPANIRTKLPQLQECARRLVDKMEAMGGECDFVKDIAVYYPLMFITTLMNIPEEDHDKLLNLTLRLLAPKDEQAGEGANSVQASKEFAGYFAGLLADRRVNPTEDLASIIANAEVDGELIGNMEAISYYIVMATAGHDTTSSTLSCGIHQLLQNPDQFAQLRANPKAVPLAVEEMFRFASPVKHFVRTAAQDFELRGKTIREGDALALLFHFANFDEEVFNDPYSFRIDRAPNRHIAFGMGAHSCLGQHLARLVIPTFLAEFNQRVESVELAGEPKHVASNRVSGLASLPVRYRFRKQEAA
ncbi:MAG: cytochrome P450 [Novosphingobium sp.]